MSRFAALFVVVLFLSLLVALFAHWQSTNTASAGTPVSTGVTETDKLLAQVPLFTKDDPWRKDISKEPVDPRSDAIIANIGAAKALHPDFGPTAGIPFQFVDKNTPTVLTKFAYPDESDRGPYPIPDNPIIEGGMDAPKDSDRHIICIDKDTWRLYELFAAIKNPDGWSAGSGALFDLTKISVGQRKQGWTSCDAAGLPIFPGLVRYDEAAITKKIEHAVRFTVRNSRHAYVSPATHYASAKTDPNLPPMGMRVRLKAGVDIAGYPEEDRVILTAMKTYGMFVADNGGDWFVTGTPDPRWNDDHLNLLKKIKGGDFEVVLMKDVVTR